MLAAASVDVTAVAARRAAGGVQRAHAHPAPALRRGRALPVLALLLAAARGGEAALGAYYTVTTLAGGGVAGYKDGVGTSALFRSPYGVACASSGCLVADTGNNVIRAIALDGTVTTLAGGGGVVPPISGTADGLRTNALFDGPGAIAFDSSENAYILDKLNNKIRKLTPNGAVVTLAGGGASGRLNGYNNAVATSALFAFSAGNRGLAVNASGHVFVFSPSATIDYLKHLRMIKPNGAVSTLFDSSAIVGTDGIAVDSTGSVHFTDTDLNIVRVVTPRGVMTTVAGGGQSRYLEGALDGAARTLCFQAPTGWREIRRATSLSPKVKEFAQFRRAES